MKVGSQGSVRFSSFQSIAQTGSCSDLAAAKPPHSQGWSGHASWHLNLRIANSGDWAAPKSSCGTLSYTHPYLLHGRPQSFTDERPGQCNLLLSNLFSINYRPAGRLVWALSNSRQESCMAETTKLSGKQTDNFLAQQRLRDSEQQQSEVG